MTSATGSPATGRTWSGSSPTSPAPRSPARRTLSFSPAVETAIYDTLPHNLDRLLRRHPLACPVGFIGGTRSAEMRQVGMTMTRKVIGRDHPERMRMVEGSHLFPMERPAETAETIATMLGGWVETRH